MELNTLLVQPVIYVDEQVYVCMVFLCPRIANLFDSSVKVIKLGSVITGDVKCKIILIFEFRFMLYNYSIDKAILRALRLLSVRFL